MPSEPAAIRPSLLPLPYAGPDRPDQERSTFSRFAGATLLRDSVPAPIFAIAEPTLHNRQLVIGPEPFSPLPDWRRIQIGSSCWVTHCPRLRSGTARDADGRQWALLGLAVQTLDGEADPLEQIRASRSEAVPDLYPAWAGRWLLVGNHEVHLDASALLGCFYGRSEEGQTWASSSPALVEQAIAPDGLPTDQRTLRFEQGYSWYPPPRSRLQGIRRLLPSQGLDLERGTVRSRPLLPPIDPDRGYERTLRLLADALITALRRLPEDPNPLWLALSSGLDSRVVVAAAERGGVRYVPFMRISGRMSAADRLITPRLAQALGRELAVHRRGPRRRRATTRDRLPLVMAHSAAHVSEGDAQPLLHGVRDTMVGISAGGWGFGVGKALERDRLPDRVADPADVGRRLAEVMGEPPGSTAIDGLREWLQWVLETPQANLDWRDRLYIEQRMAGWQSSKEQVYDLVPLERFPPINSARCYALLLEVDETLRSTQQHQRDLVALLCPQLAGIPANPPESELDRWRVMAARLRDDPVLALRRGAARAVGGARRRSARLAAGGIGAGRRR